MKTEADDVIGQALHHWDDIGFAQTPFSTDNYLLAIGMPVEVGKEGFPRLVYCVVNRLYGVVEHSDTVLARTIQTMNDMERALVQLNASAAAQQALSETLQ